MKRRNQSLRRLTGGLGLLLFLLNILTACGAEAPIVPITLSGQDSETGCHWSAALSAEGVVELGEPEIGDLSTVFPLSGKKAGEVTATFTYAKDGEAAPQKVKIYRVRVDDDKQIVYSQVSGVTRTAETFTVLQEEIEPCLWVCEAVEGGALTEVQQEITLPAETNVPYDTEISYGTADAPNVHSFAWNVAAPGEATVRLCCKNGDKVQKTVTYRVTVDDDGIAAFSES